jgi:hypothetical protein
VIITVNAEERLLTKDIKMVVTETSDGSIYISSQIGVINVPLPNPKHPLFMPAKKEVKDIFLILIKSSREKLIRPFLLNLFVIS